MNTIRFWFLAVVLGVSAALGCTTDSDEGTSADEATPSQPAAADESSTTAEHHAQASDEGAESEAPVSFDSPPPVGTTAQCPVMGNEFVVSADTLRSEHEGRHYVFCCPACKPRFDDNPAEFLADTES